METKSPPIKPAAVTGGLHPNRQYNIYWTKYNRLSKMLFLYMSYPKSQPLDWLSRAIRFALSMRSQQSLLFLWPTTTPHQSLTNLRKILRMPITQYTSIDAPGSRSRWILWSSITQLRCGLNLTLSTEIWNLRRVQCSSSVGIEITSVGSQT